MGNEHCKDEIRDKSICFHVVAASGGVVVFYSVDTTHLLHVVL